MGWKNVLKVRDGTEDCTKERGREEEREMKESLLED